MGYLNLPGGIPDFNKAIISLWFRVPSASLTALVAASNTPGSRLRNILPLLTFGKMFEGYERVTVPAGTESYNEIFWTMPRADGNWVLSRVEPHTNEIYTEIKGAAIPISPSYVGIWYKGDNDDGTGIFELHVYLQTQDHGSPINVGLQSNLTVGDRNSGEAIGGGANEDHWSYATQSCQGGVPAPGNPWVVRNLLSDNSEFALRAQGPDAFHAGYNIEVKPDTWHHALISFDLSKSTSAQGFWVEDISPGCAPQTRVANIDPTYSNPCKMWIAFDDKNHTKDDIVGGNPYPFTGQLGDNDILSRNTFTAATAVNGINQDLAWDAAGVVGDFLRASPGRSSYSYPGASLLPSSGFPFGIPAAANMVDDVYDVDMAEFQMWMSKTVDTAGVENRRLFIDFVRDKDGIPVPDKDGKLLMKPVPPSVAEQTLGRPQILLHRTSKWKTGENTGTLGTDAEGNPAPAGRFAPSGTILQYKPDPSLSSSPGPSIVEA